MKENWEENSYGKEKGSLPSGSRQTQTKPWLMWYYYMLLVHKRNPFSKLFLLRLNFNLRVHRGSVCGLTWRHLQPQHLSQEVQQVIKLHFTCVKDINSKLKVNFFGSFDFGLVVVVSNQLITIQIWSFSIWDIYLHVAYVVRDFGTLELNGAHFSYAWQMRAWKFLALILSDLPKLN